VMPQFGASLTDDSRIILYGRNMLKIQDTGSFTIKPLQM
jgi:hypothetical protein